MERQDPNHGGQGLSPLKKRALSCSSGGGRSSKMQRVDAGAETKDTGAREAPVPRRRRSPSVPAGSREPFTAAVSDEEARLRKGKCHAVVSDEEDWLRKGKWKVGHESSPDRHAMPEVKKFMHDGIRSLRHSDERPPPAKKKLMHDGMRSLAQSRPPQEKKKLVHDGILTLALNNNGVQPPPRAYADPGRLSEAQRRRLAELGATAPWCVLRKRLTKSDVCENQNRLLVSRKKGDLKRCAITGSFSRGELERVANVHAGLYAAALDADGAAHQIVCKYLDSNGGYRFISEWKNFLGRNGVVLGSGGDWARHVEVEVLAFRSRALPFQPRLTERGKVDFVRDGERIVKDEAGRDVFHPIDEHLHTDGSLGLILLLHETRRSRVKSEEEEEEDGGGEEVQQHENRRRVKSEEEEEDNGGGGEGPSLPPVACERGKKEGGKLDAPASAATAVAPDRMAPWEELADAVASLRGGEAPSPEMLIAAIGLDRLRRQYSLKERQEHVERGGHDDAER